MAHGNITLTNPATDEIKIVPVGFSWTVLFWGCFPALFRQDWKNFAIIAGTLVLATMFMVGFIPLIIFSFIYNDKMCLKNYLESGWKIRGYVGTKSLEAVSATVGYKLDKFLVQQ